MPILTYEVPDFFVFVAENLKGFFVKKVKAGFFQDPYVIIKDGPFGTVLADVRYHTVYVYDRKIEKPIVALAKQFEQIHSGPNTEVLIEITFTYPMKE